MNLLAGTRVSFVQNGRNLKGIVADYLDTGEEDPLIPVVRPMNRKTPIVNADCNKPRNLKLRWILRSKLSCL